MSLYPKEHGAYGQMAFPLVTSLLVTGLSRGAVAFAVAIVAGFLAHEPMLVVLGLRGPRARRESGRTATRWLVVLLAVLVASGSIAALSMPAPLRGALLLPLIPAMYLFRAAATGGGKSLAAEIAVAIAFSLAAIPLCLLGDPSPIPGIAIAVVFATNFVLATLAVRVIILKVRGGGDPRAAATTRRAVVILAIATASSIAATIGIGVLPAAPMLSAVPALAVPLWIAAAPPPPTRLRAIGWTLIATSTAIAMLLVITLHRL
jgi:hypothetical protein